MTNLYIIVFVLCAIGGAALYVYKSKKAGAGCVGCPHAKSCGGVSCGCDEGENT